MLDQSVIKSPHYALQVFGYFLSIQNVKFTLNPTECRGFIPEKILNSRLFRDKTIKSIEGRAALFFFNTRKSTNNCAAYCVKEWMYS